MPKYRIAYKDAADLFLDRSPFRVIDEDFKSEDEARSWLTKALIRPSAFSKNAFIIVEESALVTRPNRQNGSGGVSRARVL
jgi:hypothetical protein